MQRAARYWKLTLFGCAAAVTQLAVFATDGHLLARRQVTSSPSCVSHETRESEIARQPADRQRLFAEFAAAECLPAQHRVGGSVSNFVYWYGSQRPAPRVIEEAGKITAVELNDLDGKRMRVTLDPRTVRSQQPVDRQQRH